MAKLPVINSTFYETSLPSTKEDIRFRPYKVLEEKILLSAAETNSTETIMRSVIQIIGNCLEDRNFNLKKLTNYDVTWLWIQLTSKSVNNIFDVDYIIDEEARTTIPVKVNFDEVKVEYPETDLDPKFQIDKDLGVTFKKLSFFDTISLEKSGLDITNILSLGIKNVFDNSEVYEFSDYSKKEISEFIDNLDHKTVAYFEKFIRNEPKVIFRKKVIYKDEEVDVELEGLGDFFQLR